jgi:hypothetical protein
MTGDIRQSVISGLPYPVTSIVGGELTTLDVFLGDTEFTIDMKGNQHLVRGHGSKLDDKVRFHEKDHIAGKDVRVWHVTACDHGGFQAEAIAAF